MKSRTTISMSRSLLSSGRERVRRLAETLVWAARRSNPLKRIGGRHRDRDIVPSLAKGVVWEDMPPWFKEAHRTATASLAGETDLREVAERLSQSRRRFRGLWNTVVDLLTELDLDLEAFGISDDTPFVLELDDTGRVWVISRDCPSDAVINAGFGALADGVSVLIDLSRCKPVGAAMFVDSLRPLQNGKRIEIRITCTRELDSYG